MAEMGERRGSWSRSRLQRLFQGRVGEESTAAGQTLPVRNTAETAIMMVTVVLTLVTRVSGLVTRQFLHRGSCLYLDVNSTILPVYEPELSSLGDGSHRRQGNW